MERANDTTVMPTEAGVRLRVAEQFVSDAARGRCRLHEEVMDRLELSPGDPVEIACEDGTVAAFAYPVDPGRWRRDDANPEGIHVALGTYLDTASDDVEGRRVRVQPVSPKSARMVAYGRLPPGTAPEVRAMLRKSNLRGTLAVAGTRMPAFREEGSSTSVVFVPVMETDPDGVVVVTSSTELEPRPGESTD